MRSILEKALVALLNEDKEKADALFHDFILERSRQIHESLRQGEDFVLDESWEQELAIDEMFSDADLSEDEDDMPGDDAPAAEEVPAEEPVAGDEVDGEEGEEHGEDGEEGEVSLEDRVEDLEAQLAALMAEFDADDMGHPAAEVDVDVEEPVTEGTLEIVQHNDGELDLHHEVGGDEGMVDMPAEVPMVDDVGGDDMDDEAFEALGESAVDELEKVSVTHAEGKTTDGSQKVDTKGRALVTAPDKRQAGAPVKIKSDEHNGYGMETPPKSDTIKARKNTLKKADETQSKVSKEGDKSAELNSMKEDPKAQKSLFDKKMV